METTVVRFLKLLLPQRNVSETWKNGPSWTTYQVQQLQKSSLMILYYPMCYHLNSVLAGEAKNNGALLPESRISPNIEDHLRLLRTCTIKAGRKECSSDGIVSMSGMRAIKNLQRNDSVINVSNRFQTKLSHWTNKVEEKEHRQRR